MIMKKYSQKLRRGKEDIPLYPIGVVAELLVLLIKQSGFYERHGLIKPARRREQILFRE